MEETLEKYPVEEEPEKFEWYWGRIPKSSVFPVHNYSKPKGAVMEAPRTNLEKEALKNAKGDAIKAVIDEKAQQYERTMTEYIQIEKEARAVRTKADELAKVLGITAAEKKQLFE